MQKLVYLGLFAASLWASGGLNAQGDPDEKVRVICNKTDAKNKCTPPPGTDCACVVDTLEIVFDGKTDSILEAKEAAVGTKLTVTVMTETKSAEIQGWSYGVASDDTILMVLSATTEGTDAKKNFKGGFDATSNQKIESCTVPTDPKCAATKAGGGFISAVVLSLTEKAELPIQRNSLAIAEYNVLKAPPAGGTLIQISDRLKRQGSPPVAINFTIAGKSRLPTNVIDGWIKGEGGGVIEICNNTKDDDGDTKIDCVDPDCAADPACVPGKENCTNKVDDDKDAKIDCADDDCKADPACTPGKEICNNSKDDDADTKIDCVDPDCAADPACVPGKENCTNKVDDDKDAKIDCADDDCKADPACVPGKEICNNSKDDDADAKIDCADSDCTADPACGPQDCPDYALYFGPTATKANADLKDAKSYVISMRNKDPSLGFQLGVKATKAGTATNWEFSPTLGADANRLIELIITDDKANSKTPLTPNKASSTTGTVSKVERGAAIEKFSGQNDFFAVDLNPGVGGPGFTVGYVADTDGGAGGGNKIPATPTDATKCPVNEILEVTLGDGAPGKFSRGDADGNSKINVVDAILIIQIETGNLPEKFDCDDALDANDDGTVTTADGIRVLQYVFERGPNLPPPFRTCGTDPTDDSLTCNASNCGG